MFKRLLDRTLGEVTTVDGYDWPIIIVIGKSKTQWKEYKFEINGFEITGPSTGTMV